uniref:Uncharacterized protein n=1 Tax=Aegilops tauschii subsp. strangulata TaxID=200361 RepID=A0A453MHZ1_AEGTS
MGKVVVAEATARQVASFVLGAAAALTVVMLVQYRAPAAGLSRARTPAHFSGLRLSSDDQHHRRNATTTARPVVHHQAPPVAGSAARDDDHRRRANATTITKPNSTTTSHLPSTRRHEEKGSEGGCGVPGAGGGGGTRGNGRPDGDHHVREPGLGGTRLLTGPVPGELPHRRRHGAAPPTRAGRGHGSRRPCTVPRRAPALLPLHHPGPQHRLRRAQVLPLQGL